MTRKRSQADCVAAAFRTIFAQTKAPDVHATWDKTRDEFTARFPKLGPLMDEAKAEVLAFAVFPNAHWRKIWSTNPFEWVNKEIKRRSRVVGIFPNDAAVIRLVGAVLLDMHDEWIPGDRRYLSEGSMAMLYETSDNEPRRHRECRVGTDDHLEAHQPAELCLSPDGHLRLWS